MGVFDKFSGIGVASGFKLQAKAPLDPRQVVDTIEDRNALITENGAYEGMQVYVKADKKMYCLKDLTAGTWEEFGAGGSASVQADYNQNDSTQPDYIKNRPFYDEPPTEETILDLTFSTITASGVNFWATNASVIQLTKGDTVKVVYNGTEYTQEVKELNAVLYFGNIGLGGLTPATDEPFLVANIYFPDGLSKLTPGTTVATSEPQTNATIKIAKEIENVKTINPKYIKDMYYENVIETELYNGTFTTTQVSGQSYYSATLSPYFDLGADGDKLSVVINGVETNLVVVDYALIARAGSLSANGMQIESNKDTTRRVTIETDAQYTNASIVITNTHSDIHSIPSKYVNAEGHVIEITVSDMRNSTITNALKTYFNSHLDELEIVKKSARWQLKIVVESESVSASKTFSWQNNILLSYDDPWGEVNYTYTSLRRDVAGETDSTLITTEAFLKLDLKDGMVDSVTFGYSTELLDNDTWTFGIINSNFLDYNGLLSIYRMQSYGDDAPIYFNGSVKLHEWITKAQQRSDFQIPVPTKATDLVDKQYVDGKAGGTAFNVSSFTITSSDITDTTSTVNDTTFYALTDDCKTRLQSWFNAIDFMKIISATSVRGSTSTAGYGTNLPVRMINQGSIKTIETVNNSASHLINVSDGLIQGELALLIKAQPYAYFSLKVMSEV